MAPRFAPLLLSVLVLTLAGCGGGIPRILAPPARHGAPPGPARAVTIGGPRSAPPLPAGFVGLSTELYSLELLTGTDPAAIDPVFVALVRQLDPRQRPVLRLGGDSADKSWTPIGGEPTPPWVRFTFTPNWLAVTRALAAELRARLIVGINLEAGSAALAAAEARTVLSGLGRKSVEALELGNEPELYSSFNWYRTTSGLGIKGRAPDWDPALYAAQVAAVARALPGVPLSGPAVGSPRWIAQLGTVLATDRTLSPVTVHAYPLKRCGPTAHVTAAELLSPASSTGLAASLVPSVKLAKRYGRPLRLAETNSVSCGGQPGLSDTFAAALWSVDTLFALAADGIQGVNLHTNPKVTNHLFTFVESDGHWTGVVYPIYYGALLFARAAPPGSRLLAVSGAPGGAEPVWALRTPQGALHVVAINKSATATESLALHLPGARGPATVQRLTAPSLAASTGVTIGGQSFGSETTTGELTGTPQRPIVRARDGAYHLIVPAHSAALLEVR